ncbi:MAG: L-fuculose-phosphate aldolase [Moorella sp. (in: firmicutes)]|nr:L-fuculose-phosphate aldolase [Moorella sp. (in: firmicutes)]
MLQTLKEQIVEVGRRLYRKGLVNGNEGNISIRLPGDRILTTPTGVSKGFLQADDLVIVDLDGNILEGKQKPSSEVKMHLAAYRARPDIQAAVHAHPRFATTFAVARKNLSITAMPEMVVLVGEVALVPYGTPSTTELVDQFAPYWKGHDAFLLSNHGVLTLGRDIWEALYRMESLEHYAGIILASQSLGGPHYLEPENLEKLYRLKQ